MVWSGLSKPRLLRYARNDRDKDAWVAVVLIILDPRFHGDDKGTGMVTGEWCHAGLDPASRKSQAEIASLCSQSHVEGSRETC